MTDTNTSLLSIIIPVHNSYLNKVSDCIRSIQSNKKLDVEIILVLNGVPVAFYQQVVERFKDHKINYFENVLSPSEARNLGASQANSEWLIFIDPDCTIPENYFDEILENITKEGASHCYIGRLYSSCCHRWNRYEELEHSFALNRYLYSQNGKVFSKVCVGANMAVRKDIFTNVGGFDESLGSAEDREFGARLYVNGYQIEYLERFCINHEYHASLLRTIKRHLWHATGNKVLYMKYPQVFDKPYKKRAQFILDAFTQCIRGKESVMYLFFSIAVMLPYIVKFTFVRANNYKADAALRSKA
jgi:GT2 family glycosyltransferase